MSTDSTIVVHALVAVERDVSSLQPVIHQLTAGFAGQQYAQVAKAAGELEALLSAISSSTRRLAGRVIGLDR